MRHSRKSLQSKPIPKIRIARPANRPFQLRYLCPHEQREIRVSVGNRDESAALQMKREIEAKFLLGIEVSPKKESKLGPGMNWEDFREQYRVLHLSTLRNGSAVHAESRLDLAEMILKPKILSDLSDPNKLQQLQALLLAGSQSRRKRPRSTHTVRGHMNSVVAALNWAHMQGWLQDPPKLRKIKTPKKKTMKGRPITEGEFQRLLSATSNVVGDEASASWQYVLKGLWTSALRLDELMHVSWDIPGTIKPVWRDGQLGILEIPSALQKNDTEECIPLLPWFERLLMETPQADRRGWVFKPKSLKSSGKQREGYRPDAEWVGKIIARIGKKAEVVVEAADEKTGRPVKFASAHDLRRSCGERLREAGIPPLVICSVMRHASWETTRKHYAPGNTQKDAEVLWEVLR